MAKQPPTIGPLVVTKGLMETGDQFFARRVAERGTARQIIDDALAASLDALRPDLTFFGLEADRAFVLKERDDNPDGTKPLSAEAWAACARLMEIGKATRGEVAKRAQAEAAALAQANTKARAAARLKRVKKEIAARVEMATAARVEAETIERQRKGATVEATKKRLELQARVVATRHEKIRTIYAKNGWPPDKTKVVKQIASDLGVSESTIRRDLPTIFTTTSS
jgi:hypothetical protein